MNPTEKITTHIAEYPDWRGKILAQLRQLINSTDQNLKEEWKWNTPVWSRGKLVCSIGAFKHHVKMVFFEGVYLPDPHKIINAGFDAKQLRSIDFHEGDTIDEAALKELIQAAVLRSEKS